MSETARERFTEAPDRLESEPAEFHARVRAGFLTLAAADPGRPLSELVSADAIRSGWVDLRMPELGMAWDEPFAARDLLGGEDDLDGARDTGGIHDRDGNDRRRRWRHHESDRSTTHAQS